jgi:hypothetical protein
VHGRARLLLRLRWSECRVVARRRSVRAGQLQLLLACAAAFVAAVLAAAALVTAALAAAAVSAAAARVTRVRRRRAAMTLARVVLCVTRVSAPALVMHVMPGLLDSSGQALQRASCAAQDARNRVERLSVVAAARPLDGIQ